MLNRAIQQKVLQRISCRLLCILCLTGLLHTAVAQERVLIVNSSRESIYQEYVDMLRSYLSILRQGRYTTELTDPLQLKTRQNLTDYKLIITVGLRATETYLALDNPTPLLSTFIPSPEYFAERTTRYRCRHPRCTFLFLDQPPARQLRLLRILFPQRTRLGLFDSRDRPELLAEYQRLAKKEKFQLILIPVQDSEQVVEALQKSVAEIDVLLAHPDTRLYNRNSAKGILLTTYYNRIPLLAYSSSFVNAGATAGLYSSPDELARHAAETAVQLLENRTTPPNMAYPKYYSVEINRRVSDSLDLKLPSVDKILETLKHDEAQ